jgi:hypothetical protein
MVASRKPRPTVHKPRETLGQKFDRVMREPVGTPAKLTKREARYFLKRLAGSDPHGPSGLDVIQEVRGDWGERLEILEDR